MSQHEYKYWSNNFRHHYRMFGFCRRIQINYSGEWKDQVNNLDFLDEWIELGGVDFEPQVEVTVGRPFEMFSYESWNTAFKNKFLKGKPEGKEFGPFDNFN